MPRIPFEQLPPDARLWIFSAERELSDEESRRLLAEVDAFLGQWTAHGTSLTAGRELRHRRFIFVAVDERAAGVSGCSIDALVRRMQHMEQALGVELLDNMPVVYRAGSNIDRVSREQFAELVAGGAVDLNTQVFDNTVSTVGAVRAGQWEVRAADAWHARAFF